MGRTSRVLPREPCAPARELGRLEGRHDGCAGLSRGRVVAKCSATKGRTDEAEAAPSLRGGGGGRRVSSPPGGRRERSGRDDGATRQGTATREHAPRAPARGAEQGRRGRRRDDRRRVRGVPSASCPLSRRPSGLHVSSEPPDAERHVRWCGSWGRATAPGYPILCVLCVLCGPLFSWIDSQARHKEPQESLIGEQKRSAAFTGRTASSNSPGNPARLRPFQDRCRYGRSRPLYRHFASVASSPHAVPIILKDERTRPFSRGILRPSRAADNQGRAPEPTNCRPALPGSTIRPVNG